MNILFIHKNLPGQFRHLMADFSKHRRNTVVGICQSHAPGLQDESFARVKFLAYESARQPSKQTHQYVNNMEASVLNGQAVARTLLKMKSNGLTPDFAIAHIGWGEALYFKDIFPNTPLIGYCEYYYHTHGTDADFDPAFPISLDDRLRIRTLNAATLLSLASCDICVSPTCWQKQLFPKEFHSKIRVIHEGVDVDRVRPNHESAMRLADGTLLENGQEIVTFVARNLEPYRGFHVFMRAVQEICERRPKCQIAITGGDGVSYGRRLPNGQTYRERLLKEVNIDHSRVHFLGTLPYERYLSLLQVSSVHVYLTIPFVLSWSLMEAMSTGCTIIGSDTSPVKEMIRQNENGLLVDFFDHEKVANYVDQICTDRLSVERLGLEARKTIVNHYQVAHSLEQYRALYESVL